MSTKKSKVNNCNEPDQNENEKETERERQVEKMNKECFYTHINVLTHGSSDIILTSATNSAEALTDWESNDYDPLFLVMTPTSVHYLCQLLSEGKVEYLKIWGFEDFFAYPLLVFWIKDALAKKQLSVEIPDIFLEEYSDCLFQTEEEFKVVELMHALMTYGHNEVDFNIEVFDTLYERIIEFSMENDLMSDIQLL